MNLKIVSLNIWSGGKLWDELIDFLTAQDADIVALQEVYHTEATELLEPQYHSFDLICDELDFEYAHFSPAFIEAGVPNKVEQGSAIFSRHQLEPLETVFYDIPYGKRDDSLEGWSQLPRNLQHALITLDDTKLHYFNTHGIWAEDGDDSTRRFEMVDTILTEIEKVGNNLPIILSGDFNFRQETEAVAKLSRQLNNVFADQLTSTFNLRRKTEPGFSDAVVDMMFVSPHIEVISQVCSNLDISDHLPLVVEIKI